ncbi:MAG: helix-turn-helix domain-containing protein [Tissierellia bacterium]|nr:helix-turn-helix domain-containing protein [Tissierellia bacterium]
MGTKENLLYVAKSEFLERGYEEASLREIARKSGVTTGAIYGYFKDKNELFETVVKKELHTLMEIHNEFNHDTNHKTMELLEIFNNFENDVEKQRILIEKSLSYYKFLYENRALFLLLIYKIEGNRYEKYLDEFIEMDYQSSLEIIQLKKGGVVDKYTKKVLKLFIKNTIPPIFDILKDIENFQEARPYLEIYIRMYMSSFIQLLK